MGELELLAPFLKVGGGGAAILYLLYLLAKHLLPSATERLATGQRRLESDAARAQKWENDWKQCEGERELTTRRLDRLSWCYDDTIILARSETAPESVKRQIAARPLAQQVCDEVKLRTEA